MRRKNLVLIVEDDERNIKAAKFCFSKHIKNVQIDFAKTYFDGLKKLERNRKKYQCAIFDKQLPQFEGDELQDFGFNLANNAKKLLLPYAIVTSGIDHHRCQAAFVSYFWQDNEFHEITETPKDNPKAWEIIYKTLINPFRNSSNLTPMYWAMKRITPDVSSVLMMPIGKLVKKILTK